MLKIAFSLLNSGDTPVEVVLEPWGDVYRLDKGTLDVVSLSPEDQRLTFEVASQGNFVIWGEAGDVVGIFRDDVELHGRDLESEMPVPGVPPARARGRF